MTTKRQKFRIILHSWLHHTAYMTSLQDTHFFWTVSPRGHSRYCTRLRTTKVKQAVVWRNAIERASRRCSNHALLWHLHPSGQLTHGVWMCVSEFVTTHNSIFGSFFIWHFQNSLIYLLIYALFYWTEDILQRFFILTLLKWNNSIMGKFKEKTNKKIPWCCWER